jgi:hypothetical protein
LNDRESVESELVEESAVPAKSFAYDLINHVERTVDDLRSEVQYGYMV